jgi:hypothetical protein
MLERTFTKITSRVPVAPPFVHAEQPEFRAAWVNALSNGRSLSFGYFGLSTAFDVGASGADFISPISSLSQPLSAASLCAALSAAGVSILVRADPCTGWRRHLSYLERASDTSYLRLSGLRSAFIISRGFARSERD